MPGQPAQWIPYILVADVDATVEKAAKLRGKVCMPPRMCRQSGASPFSLIRKARPLESSSRRCKLSCQPHENETRQYQD
jgi:hypothetical protein